MWMPRWARSSAVTSALVSIVQPLQISGANSGVHTGEVRVVYDRVCAEVPLTATNINAVVSGDRSEEHTSELQSLMRTSYAVFCLKKKKKIAEQHYKPVNTMDS